MIVLLHLFLCKGGPKARGRQVSRESYVWPPQGTQRLSVSRYQECCCVHEGNRGLGGGNVFLF